jgi:DNA-binding SARP family transcriptional activator
MADAGERARAAAHLAASLSAVGSRRAGHLGAALAAATAAGDLVQATRALVNQAESLIREAQYPDAYAVAARAVAAGERGCPPGMLTAALANAGDALLHLGRYDEAAAHFERVIRLAHRAGLRRAAVGHWGLAEVHSRVGRWERGRTAFEEAAQLARADGDGQVLVPSLTGLVRVLLGGPAPDVAAARAAAEEAERAATGLLTPLALAARGWVAYAEGDLVGARDRAAAAVAAARQGRRADCLAGALELLGTVSADSAHASAALHEAEAIWRAAGAHPAADRVQVLLGRRPNADAGRRRAARAAARRLLDLGVRTVDGADLRLADSTAPVRIRVLGGFDAFVDGRPVPLPAWRSRQARSLVKILVARRGRPVPRPELRDLLWPDEDAHRTAHRLSVLLSAVRTVLDPGRRWPADHHVCADLSGVWLDTDHVAVDALELIRDAAHADRLRRAGTVAEAREMLAHVDDLYRGDAFCDEPYEQWADGLREEARAVWLRAVRELAGLSRRAGEPDHAVTLLVRLLGADPYDEVAHRDLVEVLVHAGRHGEARRAFDRWRRAMRSLDVPAPSRLVLRSPPARHSGVSLQ